MIMPPIKKRLNDIGIKEVSGKRIPDVLFDYVFVLDDLPAFVPRAGRSSR